MAHTYSDKKLIAEDNSNPVTGTFTCAAGVTLLVFHITTDHANERTGTPTYNLLPLTQAGTSQFSGVEGWAEIWYLLAPPTESDDAVSVPNPGADNVQVAISSYISSTGESAFDKSAQDAAAGANPSVSITPSAVGNIIVDSMFNGQKDVGTGDRQQLYVNDTGSESNGCQYHIATDTNPTAMSYTWASDDWGIVVASFKETIPFVEQTKTIEAKATINKTFTQTITSKGNIFSTPTQTVQSKARIATVIYTREANAALPSNDVNLTTLYSDAEIAEVATDDGNRVALIGTGYLLHQFKNRATNNNQPINVLWNGQSSKAPSDVTVYLQVYNRDTPAWETLDSNNAANADTDFNLEGIVSSSLSDYYDAGYWVAFRIYQQV